jgi:SAM-dependent methyltransferase
MNELPIPGSWLACPRCERTPLVEVEGRYRCDACRVDFPLVGGIPWLFAEPGAELGEWRGRVAATLQELRQEQARLSAAAARAHDSALTQRRLRLLADATQAHAQGLEALLAPLAAASPAATYATNLAFRPQVPWDQGLMTYAYNIHRDWSWGADENEASFDLVDEALASGAPGKVLVLGAGAGRLAYDLHMRTGAAATVVLDFNPFLLLLARYVTSGNALQLYEFPRAPKSLDDSAVLRTLAAERPSRAGLHYVLADAQRPPFPPGDFDTVITPWLVDILPEPLPTLCRRINALLRSGGRWINFGSLDFHVGDPALQFSREECAEIIAATGFDAPRLRDATLPYLCSPASRHGRLEQVLAWSATKRNEAPPAARPQLLPGWLVAGREPVPLLDVFRLQAPATRIRGYILSLIDGRRSLNEIVAIFDQQKLMTHEEAEATIRSLLIRMYQSSSGA